MMESAASQCKFLSNRFAVNEVLIQRKRLSKTSRALKCLDKLLDEAFSPPYFYSLCCWKIVSEVALPKLYLVLCFIYTWKKKLKSLTASLKLSVRAYYTDSQCIYFHKFFLPPCGWICQCNWSARRSKLMIFTNCKYQHWCSFLFLFCFWFTKPSNLQDVRNIIVSSANSEN